MDTVRKTSLAGEIVEELVDRGVKIFEEWEENHIFGDYTPPSSHAVRELITSLFQELNSSCTDTQKVEVDPPFLLIEK